MEVVVPLNVVVGVVVFVLGTQVHRHVQHVAMDVVQHAATILHPLRVQHVAMDAVLLVATIPHPHVLIVLRNVPHNVRGRHHKHVRIVQLDVLPAVAMIVITLVLVYAVENVEHHVVDNVKGNADMGVKQSVLVTGSSHIVHHAEILVKVHAMRTAPMIATPPARVTDINKIVSHG